MKFLKAAEGCYYIVLVDELLGFVD